MKMKRVVAGVFAAAVVASLGAPAMQGVLPTMEVYAAPMDLGPESDLDINTNYKEGVLTYQYSQMGFIQIVGCEKDVEEVVIPDTIEGFPVKVLYGGCFQDCTKLKKVTIPDTVTKIGSYAFCNCISLEEVVGMESVEIIGECGFVSCTSLTKITLPDTLWQIGIDAFTCCSALKEITLPGSVRDMAEYVFNSCSSLETLTISEGMETLGGFATYMCTNLKTVNIPASLKTIRVGAFSYSGLEEITIPDTVEVMESDAFYSCMSLKKVTLSAGMSRINMNVFNGCNNLESVVIPDSITEIRNGAFVNCEKLTDVKLPAKLNKLGDYIFYGCASLKSMEIPSTITVIPDSMFTKCRSLENFVIPDNITYIGSNAFYECDSLTEMVVPESVNTVGSYAFYGCDNIKSLKFENSVSDLGIWCMAGCTSLTDLQLPKGLKTFSNHMLYRCKSLESVEIEDTVTKLDKFALAGCDSMTVINIPDGVKRMYSYSVGYGEGAYPELDPDIIVSSNSETVKEFCKDNGVKMAGEEQQPTEAPTDEPTEPTDEPTEPTEENCGGNVDGLPTKLKIGETAEVKANGSGLVGGVTKIWIEDESIAVIEKVVDNDTVIIKGVSAGTTNLIVDFSIVAGGLEFPFTVVSGEDPTDESQDPTDGPSEITIGDADGNGTIDILDVIALNRAIVGAGSLDDAGKAAADVDGDGIPTASDSLMILKFVVKLIPTLEPEVSTVKAANVAARNIHAAVSSTDSPVFEESSEMQQKIVEYFNNISVLGVAE